METSYIITKGKGMIVGIHDTHATVASARQRSVRVWKALRNAIALRRQRAALARLDNHILDDIGVSLEEARQEASRPIWDVPASWRK